MARSGTDKQYKTAKKQTHAALEAVQDLNSLVVINFNPQLNEKAEQAERLIEEILIELNKNI